MILDQDLGCQQGHAGWPSHVHQPALHPGGNAQPCRVKMHVGRAPALPRAPSDGGGAINQLHRGAQAWVAAMKPAAELDAVERRLASVGQLVLQQQIWRLIICMCVSGDCERCCHTAWLPWLTTESPVCAYHAAHSAHRGSRQIRHHARDSAECPG
eukprot:jgi/Ulvmu1/3985/UM183_0004.1